jgi:hypothetical protein
MYRKEDIESIALNLDNIKDEAEYECRTKNDPTLDEMSNVYGDIMDYLRTNNIIAYGGFAQNLLIGAKDKAKAIRPRSCPTKPDSKVGSLKFVAAKLKPD